MNAFSLGSQGVDSKPDLILDVSLSTQSPGSQVLHNMLMSRAPWDQGEGLLRRHQAWVECCPFGETGSKFMNTVNGFIIKRKPGRKYTILVTVINAGNRGLQVIAIFRYI